MDFLILDEGEYFLLRVELDDEKAENFKIELDSLVDKSSDFTDVISTTWSPEDDAKNRILGARERAIQGGISFDGIPAGGWKIETWRDDRWIVEPDDLDKKIEKFGRFMSKVIGKFTRAYLEEIPKESMIAGCCRYLFICFYIQFQNNDSKEKQEPSHGFKKRGS